MKKERFSERSVGKLVPITIPTGSDYAFIPNPLPPQWDFPNELWPKLAEAKEALAKLDGIGRTLPDPNLLLSPLKRQEAITSSRLEGTYATAQELMLFEISPREPKSKNDQVHAWQEVHNYVNALAEGMTLLEEMPFCLRLFKILHRSLMRDVRGAHATAGEWRQHQVAIGSDRRYVPPPPSEVEHCLSLLEKYINEDHRQYDPLVRAYIVHYQLEAIHPFADGNGRIGRVLLSLMISNWRKMSLPWLYMSSFFERFRDEYVKKMFEVSAKGAWTPWIDFCLTGTIAQANDAVRRCEALRELQKKMIKDVRRNCSKRSERIVDGLFSLPIVRVANLSKDFGGTYPTAFADVRGLVAAGILAPLEGVTGRAYYAPGICAIAYKETDY